MAKVISKSIQNLLWIDKCPGEKHGLNPQGVKDTYLCQVNSAPLVQNHVSITSESDIKKGVGRAGSTLIVFDNMPLFTELMNKFNYGEFIDWVKVFTIELADDKSCKPRISIQYSFKDVMVISLSAFFANKRIVVDGIDSNCSFVVEFNYDQYQVSQCVLDVHGETKKITVATSNSHGYGFAGK